MEQEKIYVFTREVKAWGVEEGDCYNPQYHMYKGGTEKLLQEGIIKEDKPDDIDRGTFTN